MSMPEYLKPATYLETSHDMCVFALRNMLEDSQTNWSTVMDLNLHLWSIEIYVAAYLFKNVALNTTVRLLV